MVARALAGGSGRRALLGCLCSFPSPGSSLLSAPPPSHPSALGCPLPCPPRRPACALRLLHPQPLRPPVRSWAGRCDPLRSGPPHADALAHVIPAHGRPDPACYCRYLLIMGPPPGRYPTALRPSGSIGGCWPGCCCSPGVPPPVRWSVHPLPQRRPPARTAGPYTVYHPPRSSSGGARAWPRPGTPAETVLGPRAGSVCSASPVFSSSPLPLCLFLRLSLFPVPSSMQPLVLCWCLIGRGCAPGPAGEGGLPCV